MIIMRCLITFYCFVHHALTSLPNHFKNMLTDGSVLNDAIQALNLPPLKKDQQVMMFFTPKLENFLSRPLSKRLSLRCLPCFRTTLPNRLLRSLFPTLCLIANSRLLTTSMEMKSPSSLLIGWTPIVQTWTLSSVKPFVIYKLVNWQPTAIPLPLQNDYEWYRIFWAISSICTIFCLQNR